MFWVFWKVESTGLLCMGVRAANVKFEIMELAAFMVATTKAQ